jgi:hypothetical protein
MGWRSGAGLQNPTEGVATTSRAPMLRFDACFGTAFLYNNGGNDQAINLARFQRALSTKEKEIIMLYRKITNDNFKDIAISQLKSIANHSIDEDLENNCFR